MCSACTWTGISSAEVAPMDRIDVNTAFLPAIELAPFEVKGEELSISVFARSSGDRRYAERFAQSVVEVAYNTMEKSTKHGLVIVGDKGEPHPVFVFRRFLELEEEGRLNGAMAKSAVELRAMIQRWEGKAKFADDGDMGNLDIDIDTIIPAFPLPLEGVASKLYLVAWMEDFDPEKIDERLTSLSAEDLKSEELAKYDWVFYLPPKSTLNQLIKEVLPAFMKEAELGFFKRVAIRGAVATFKPLIKDGMEGLRKGMLFLSILRAVGEYEDWEVESLTEAYIEALMPHGKLLPGKKKQRAIEAIEARKLENIEYAKNPFVSPEPLKSPDLTLYSKFEGEYGHGKKVTHRFSMKAGNCFWQYLDWKPGLFLPAGESLFVSEDGKMTIEFLYDEEGRVSSVEERWVRRRKIIPQRF